MDTQSPNFGSFTWEKPSGHHVFVSGLGADGQPNRRRKVHTKSRFGCTNCKARKVKCDQEHPCRNCVKRKQKCHFITAIKPRPPILREQQPAQNPIIPTPSIPDRQLCPINLKHMRLLNHFRHFTSETFIMEPKAWRETVVTLALENTFLMHAVLLVASSHLQHLQPQEKKHQIVALEHLSQALPMFRGALATTYHGQSRPTEAFIACSMLLLQYSWTFDSEWLQSILGLYQGLTHIVLDFGDLSERNPFSSMLIYSPRMRIEGYLKDKEVPSNLEEIFSHCLSCTKISEMLNGNQRYYAAPSQRLVTIMCALRLGNRHLEESGLVHDVARYLFSWPNLLPDRFVNLVKMRDRRAQVILLYYFVAVSRLRCERFWWMRDRAVYMYEAISFSLGERCTDCTGRATEMFEEEDLE